MKAELELGQAKQRGSLEERIALICAETTGDSDLGDSMPLTDQSQPPFDSV